VGTGAFGGTAIRRLRTFRHATIVAAAGRNLQLALPENRGGETRSSAAEMEYYLKPCPVHAAIS